MDADAWEMVYLFSARAHPGVMKAKSAQQLLTKRVRVPKPDAFRPHRVARLSRTSIKFFDTYTQIFSRSI